MARCIGQIPDGERCKSVKGKVLFVATVFSHLASFHIPFMQMLKEKGYEVHAAASPHCGRQGEVVAAGAICWDVPFSRSPFSPLTFKAWRELWALLREHRYDLIHVHTPIAAFMGRYLAKATQQGPVIYTAHGFHFHRGAPLVSWLLYYTAERLAARWTDGLVVINDEDYSLAQKLGYKPNKNLFFVPGVGIDLQAFALTPVGRDGIRAELGLTEDAFVVTCVAELSANKNHTFLLDAWANFVQHNAGHLLLVGTGDMERRLRNRVELERISRVHFLGYRNDVGRIYAESDVAVLVSKREGLPRSVMESMAAGKPVIATNVRGNSDLVVHEQTGLLIELGDIVGLAQALEQLAISRDRRVTMGAAGKERVQQYALENVLREMQGIYNLYLLERQSPRRQWRNT